MRVFLSIKFWGDSRNQEDVRQIIGIIEGLGHEVFCVVEHAEKWGVKSFSPGDLMSLTFSEIDQSSVLVANVADWPIGVGVEVGYAYARGIPVICICPRDKKLADTVAGISSNVIQYGDYADLKFGLKECLGE